MSKGYRILGFRLVKKLKITFDPFHPGSSGARTLLHETSFASNLTTNPHMKVEFQMKNDRSDPHLQFTFMNEEKLDLNINGQRMADIMEDLEELSWDMVNNKKVKNPEMDEQDDKHDIPLPC